MKDNILIIDGFNYLFRAYYGLPSAIKLPDGRQGNAVYGFLAFMRRIVEYLNPENVVVVFDSETGLLNKKIEMPEYKSNRNNYDDEMFQQLSIIKQLLEIAEVPVIEDPDSEADDVIGTLASNRYFSQSTKYISSGDNDFVQLVSNEIFLAKEVQGRIKTLNVNGVLNKYNIMPSQYVDYISLKGDVSDNIKGVPGIGAITARKLLNEYNDIHGVIENVDKLRLSLSENIKRYQEYIIKNKEFLRINTDLNLDSYLEQLQNKYNSDILFSKTNEIISYL
ncbi:MAG TPA: 5'-3' exonuclease [Candidatus Dojkabacteria bacterium]|nr:5'-3' exonuclease [Candidatus Dojkabacteria bacterium]